MNGFDGTVENVDAAVNGTETTESLKQIQKGMGEILLLAERR